MTLKSAQLAGIDIPPVPGRVSIAFCSRVRRGQAGGLAAYRPNSSVSRSMTAEALFCRQLQHEQHAGHVSSAPSKRRSPPSPKSFPRRPSEICTSGITPHSLCIAANTDGSTAQIWEDWNHALTTTLLTTQQGDGSWDVNTAWGGCGGRVYTTAFSALCLEVYYRYNPVDDPGELARRRQWQGVHR